MNCLIIVQGTWKVKGVNLNQKTPGSSSQAGTPEPGSPRRRATATSRAEVPRPREDQGPGASGRRSGNPRSARAMQGFTQQRYYEPRDECFTGFNSWAQRSRALSQQLLTWNSSPALQARLRTVLRHPSSSRSNGASTAGDPAPAPAAASLSSGGALGRAAWLSPTSEDLPMGEPRPSPSPLGSLHAWQTQNGAAKAKGCQETEAVARRACALGGAALGASAVASARPQSSPKGKWALGSSISTGLGRTCWRAALWRGTWVCWGMTGWPWASSVPRMPRRPMASWGALRSVASRSREVLLPL